MMAVCDVNVPDSRKCFLYLPDICRILHDPDPVSDAVGGYEIIFRLFFLGFFHDPVNNAAGAVSQKDRSRLGIACVYVADPVLLLFRSCIFMLFDHPGFIIVNRGAGHDPGLGPAVHCQFINIVARRLVPDKISFFYHIPQSIMSSLIYLRRIHTYRIVKLCFRPVDF